MEPDHGDIGWPDGSKMSTEKEAIPPRWHRQYANTAILFQFNFCVDFLLDNRIPVRLLYAMKDRERHRRDGFLPMEQKQPGKACIQCGLGRKPRQFCGNLPTSLLKVWPCQRAIAGAVKPDFCAVRISVFGGLWPLAFGHWPLLIP
jgi:hypothetical protein